MGEQVFVNLFHRRNIGLVVESWFLIAGLVISLAYSFPLDGGVTESIGLMVTSGLLTARLVFLLSRVRVRNQQGK